MIDSFILRMPNWIGDLVMATPVLEDLKKAFPHAQITAMCAKPLCELLEENPYIDELFCFSREKSIRRRLLYRSVTGKIRRGKYDVGILLTNSLSSAWLFWMGKVPRRIGFKGHHRSWLLSEIVESPHEKEHLVKTYKRLLEPLGIAGSKTLPALYLREEEKKHAHALLRRHGVKENAKIIGMNPGAAYGLAKCYPLERFAEVTRKLLACGDDVYCVYVGDKQSFSLIQGICQGMPSRVINLAGQTSIRQLASVIGQCSVFVTNDSGPMHIADALGVPVVAIFGSTDPQITGPYQQGGQGWTVLYKKVACSPCFKRECPIDFRCMKGISSEEVYAKIRELL